MLSLRSLGHAPPGAWLREIDRGGGARHHFVREKSVKLHPGRDAITLEDYIRWVIISGVSWEVEYTEQFFGWWQQLSERQQRSIDFVVAHLQAEGPALGRPLVDTVTGSRHPNMKELRPRGGNIRILFAFDPRRMAILLIGGDKTGEWNAWYQRMIPIADDLYDEHLGALKLEGLLP